MSNPRELAVKILVHSQEGAYVNLELNRFLTSNISPVDRAFITELVYGVISYRNRLDYIISKFSNMKIKKMSKDVLNILRLGIYQIMFLDKIPVYAAVNESVEMAKKLNPGAAKFVNAILRNVLRKKDAIVYPDINKEPIRYLSVYYSFPIWMIENWIDLFGFEFTRELCKTLNKKADLCIRVNTLKISVENLEKQLIRDGIKIKSGLFMKEAFYILEHNKFTALESFKNGFFLPQDESSMLASKVLDAKPGESILDVAAAPGGKTTHIAQLMGNRGCITAWDIHLHRVKLLKDTCKRMGVNIVNAKVMDARVPNEKLYNCFDRVLIDAPCSGLGVIRRKPDIKWSKSPQDIKNLQKEQNIILQTCANYVKPGGVLLYSTCSIQPDENEFIIEKLLSEKSEFAYDDIRPFLPETLSKYIKKPFGHITLYPNIHKVNGFFISRLKKKR